MNLEQNEINEITQIIQRGGLKNPIVVPVYGGILYEGMIDNNVNQKQISERIRSDIMFYNQKLPANKHAMPLDEFIYTADEDRYTEAVSFRTQASEFVRGIHTSYANAGDAIVYVTKITAAAFTFGVQRPFEFKFINVNKTQNLFAFYIEIFRAHGYQEFNVHGIEIEIDSSVEINDCSANDEFIMKLNSE